MNDEMRNAYDLATAQKEKHEEVQEERAEAVSYTHLTLPTTDRV